MIVFNQAHTERVEYILDQLQIRGYSWWPEVMGQGSVSGEPRKGTHTWPEMNAAVMTVIPESQLEELLDKVKRLDQINEAIGIRAFAWDVTHVV